MNTTTTIFVCQGPACQRRSAELLSHRLMAMLKEAGWEERVQISGDYCQSLCEQGPVLRIEDQMIVGPEACQSEAVRRILAKILDAKNGGNT